MYQIIRKIASDILEASAFLDTVENSWYTLNDGQITALKDKNVKLINDLEKRKKRLISLYGSKFGSPIISRKKPVRSKTEVDQMLNYLYDNDTNDLLFAETHGFVSLFIKKATAVDYNQYCEAIELVQEHCRNTISMLDKFVQVKPSVERLQYDYIGAYANIKDITDDCKDILYIGDIEDPIEVSYGLAKLEESTYLEDGWLKSPFTYPLETPFVLLVKNNTDSAKEKNAAFIRNIIYRIMRSLPMYSYTLTYYDQGGGRNIGGLNSLCDVINYNAYFLNEKLFNHCFRQLEVYTTKQGINEDLNRFEEYIAAINKACSDYANVGCYNIACDEGRIATGTIPAKYVFFENICGATDDIGRIKKIIENSKRCGISLVICADVSARDDSVFIANQISKIPGVDVIEIENEGSSLTFSEDVLSREKVQKEQYVYQYVPCYLDHVDSGFISEFSKALNPEVELETRFEKLFDESSWWSLNGDNQIRFPVAVNLKGELEDLTLGTSTYPFGMMCGHSGCGKSSFLHTIISGVIRNYHPLDVQLWLADYKTVEFSQYTVNTPPHIRFIGLSTNKEYSISFLEKIHKEQVRRQELFEALHVTSVEDYRKICGKFSMPRLLIVIDEFHVMSNHIKDDPELKQKLTGIFREARAVGITMLLSDQTCGVGLRGLEEDAKKQIQNRLAMQTDAEEQKAIFDVSNLDEIPQVQVYEVVMRCVREVIDSNGRPQIVNIYNRCKTIYASNAVRRDIAEHSIALAEEQEIDLLPVEIVDIKPKLADFDDIGKRITAYKCENDRGIPVYLGTPLSMDKYFSFKISDTYNENVLCISKDNMQLKSLIYHQIECITRRYNEYEIYVFADENCDTFISLEEYLRKKAGIDSSFRIITDYGEICKNICILLSEIKQRTKIKGIKKPLYIIWIGLEVISKVLANYDEKRPDYYLNDVSLMNSSTFGKVQTIQSNLESLFDDLFGDIENKNVTHEDELELYNALNDIKRLLGEGGTAGIHSIVLYNTVAALKMAKCTRPENFNHKIAFSMSLDDAGDFLSRAALIKDAEGRIIDNDIAVYDGGVRDVKFMPFILED